MRDEHALHLDRRDPLPTHLEHVIGTTAIPVIALGILVILVPSMNPVAVDDILGLFVLVPIVRGRAVPTNQQIADLTLGYCVPALIGNQSLVAWYKLAAAARFYFAGTITNKNVQYLRAADAVKNIYIEFFPPAPQDIGGQGLPGRDAGTDGGEIETLLSIRQGEHARLGRGASIKNGWGGLLSYP